ncbi:hypothetical protein BTVI_26407 [Pitangus sulphuratus]|nr:hypothetical protein BTVI_26407 [Pitangus sulphuratus]
MVLSISKEMFYHSCLLAALDLQSRDKQAVLDMLTEEEAVEVVEVVVEVTRAKAPSALGVEVEEEEEEEVVEATRAKVPSLLAEEEVVEVVVEVVEATRAKVPLLLVEEEEEVVEGAPPALGGCPCSSRPSPSPGHLRLNTSSGCTTDPGKSKLRTSLTFLPLLNLRI